MTMSDDKDLRTIERDLFKSKLREWRAAKAVLETGMPQANEHEIRAMTARARLLQTQLEQCPWMENSKGEIVWKSIVRRFIERIRS
jgi:hypothetical protein